MRILTTLYAGVILLMASLAFAVDENDSSLQGLLDGTVDPVTLTSEERVDLTGKLLVLMKSKESILQRKCTTALLNLNDTQTVQQVLLNLGSSSSSARDNAIKTLMGCRNPEILPALADLLFLNEDSMEDLASEIRVPTRSLVAAHIFRHIIASSASFSPATCDWARMLDRSNPELFRETMREWWLTNAPSIKARAYDRVIIPLPVTTTNSIKRVDGESVRAFIP